MRRVSIYVMFALFAWTAIALHDYFFYRSLFLDSYEKHFANQASRLSTEAMVARSYYRENENRADDLIGYLEDRRAAHNIDFWVVEKPGGEERKGPSTESIPFQNSDAENRIRRFSNAYYSTIQLDPSHRVIVGKLFDRDAFLKIEYSDQGSNMLRYLFDLALITMAAFAFFFRDIMKSIRELTHGGRRAYGKIKVNSREADLLVRGFKAYDENTKKLEEENKIFTEQVLPALRTELTSGRAPPYDFTCTLVRTDINNFSKIYNEFPVDEFAASINDFFTDVSHVVSRYGGLVHEFVGDEVIYYFKDEVRPGDSVPLALTAIRDINAVASRFNKLTLRERGYPFTVKSSFANGSLRFGRFVNGFGLAGPSLIETVRILSHVTEKDGNVIVFDERHMAELDGFAFAEFQGQVKLKGFQEEKRLMVYRNHGALEDLLGSEDEAKFEKSHFFRSDEDLTNLIRWAREQSGAVGLARAAKIVGHMRTFLVTSTDGVPQQNLFLWIDELIRELEGPVTRFTEEKMRIMASLLRLVETMVPKSEFTHQFEEALNRAITLKNRRVVANALEALTKFRRDYEPEMAERLANHPDNRVAANALVHEGTRSITPFVVKRLQKMISSRDHFQIASAFYAVGEIASHHRKSDTVYFNTHIDFMELVQQLPSYAFHGDVMVRRQALIAARKAGEAQTLQAIHAGAALEKNKEYLPEVREHLAEAFVESRASSVKRAS